ncbi:MAG: EcsC family protein [Clostridia bacterium]|nr:EcsC family protein [Clostridia bacterium]
MDNRRVNRKLIDAIFKELSNIEAAEARLLKKSVVDRNTLKSKAEEKIPKKVNETLQKAFSKAFSLVFERGVGIIEKSYDRENIVADYDIRNYAVDRKGGRRELKKIKSSAARSDFLNMSVTAVEGIGLGALGIGFPDIMLFIGMVLKGIYEVSLHYGYEYDSPNEKYFILKLMETALAKGEDFEIGDCEINELITCSRAISDDDVKLEIENASNRFATDMLVLKFIQGLPVIGIVGGVFNPVYYRKILSYVRLKYHKRYLRDKLWELRRG